MIKKSKYLLELVFNKDIQHFELLEELLNQLLKLPMNTSWEFGSGCNAMIYFDGQMADNVLDTFLALKDKKVGALKVKEVKLIKNRNQ